jgi:DNA-binding MarR family transcriptional regulator
MNLIDDLGVLALPSRLARLSETLKKDAAVIYKELYGNVKYKLYPVLFVLYKKQPVSVVELATELSYAHPSIIQLIKELENEKLVRSTLDKTDGRKRLLSLTAKGQELAKRISRFSSDFEKVLNELLKNEHHLLHALEAVEQKLNQESFAKRVKKAIAKKESKLRA